MAREKRGRVFFCLDEETGDGDAKGQRQVVQPDVGLWVHQAASRREGCFRPYLGRRARWTHHSQRKPSRGI